MTEKKPILPYEVDLIGRLVYEAKSADMAAYYGKFFWYYVQLNFRQKQLILGIIDELTNKEE